MIKEIYIFNRIYDLTDYDVRVLTFILRIKIHYIHLSQNRILRLENLKGSCET